MNKTLIALVLVAACSGDVTTMAPPPGSPVPFVAAVAAAGGSTSAIYLSLPSGSLPTGTTALVRIVRTGATATVAIVDGGFDPISLPATPGDAVSIVVSSAGGAAGTTYGFTVPVPGPPIVVRTDPPPHKRDVPLNASLRVVFSEPVDAATLASGVQLRVGGSLVAGQLAFSDASHTSADFTPSGALLGSTDYELSVTQAITDVAGAQLASPVSVVFTTAAAPAPPAPVAQVIVSPLAATIDPDNTLQMSAMLRDSSGHTLTGRNVTWSIPPNQGGATVSASGVVTGVFSGFITLTATSEGKTGTATISVTNTYHGPVASITVYVTQPNIGVGRTTTARATVSNAAGHPLDDKVITWRSNNPAIASVAATGVVTGVATGVTTIVGTTEGFSNSRDITVIPSSAASAVSAGGDFTCSLSLAGAVSCWGNNASGQLGNGTTASSSVPVAVSGGLVFVLITTGRAHACGIATSGVAYCWGDNSSGQLGDGSTINSSVPVPVAGGLKLPAYPLGTVSASAYGNLSAGAKHTCAIVVGPSTYCWGANNDGQLGDGTFVSSSTPVLVAFGSLLQPSGVISAGGHHTCALSTHGVYCWGLNSSGQLGNNSMTSSAVPIVVQAPVDFGGIIFGAETVSAGDSHTCADTYCWGENSSGQIGDGTTTNRLLPVSVLGILYYDSYDEAGPIPSAGGNHTCAISDAVVPGFCWGGNASGQLGIGNTVSKLTPTSAPSGSIASSIVSMSAGGAHSCAVTPIGEVYCWGDNSKGQLGNGTTSSSTIPVKVVGIP